MFLRMALRLSALGVGPLVVCCALFTIGQMASAQTKVGVIRLQRAVPAPAVNKRAVQLREPRPRITVLHPQACQQARCPRMGTAKRNPSPQMTARTAARKTAASNWSSTAKPSAALLPRPAHPGKRIIFRRIRYAVGSPVFGAPLSSHFLQSSSRPRCSARPSGVVTQGRTVNGGLWRTCCPCPHTRSATQSPCSSW